MTDQMDNRLRELVTKLASSAPPAPPFPRVAAPAQAPRRRAPAWALGAGAVAVLLIIGLPFLLFGGRRAEPDVASTVPSPTTVAPATTTTTARAVDLCTPDGLLIRTLQQVTGPDHVATPVRFINVSGSPCELADPIGVTGIAFGGAEVSAAAGTRTPIGEDGGALIEAGEQRDLLVETGVACQGGQGVGPLAVEIRISLGTGDVTVPFTGDLGCEFAYSAFGKWLEADPLTYEEAALAEDVVSFAADPTAERFAALPFAGEVTLTLGPAIARVESSAGLLDPMAWQFGVEADGFRARVAPFSALDVLAEQRPIEVTVGPHDHCASPPVPVYEALDGLRQISIQPTDATSCLEWWVVDLFLSETGEIAGITLDLYEP